MPTVRKLFVPLLASAALFAVPSAAQADTWVDDTSGNNANPCTLAQPCLTVQVGVDAAGNGETVHVDGGTYAESVTLGGGKSVIFDEFSPGGADMGMPIINGGASEAITVPIGEAAGTIQGFHLRSTDTALSLAGPATVTGNLFSSTAADSTGVSVNTLAAGAAVLGPSNVFTDDGVDAERRFGVTVAAGSPTITDNDFSNLSDAIFLSSSATPTVTGNEITGAHVATSQGGWAVTVTDGIPVLAGNHIHTPDPDVFAGGVNVDELGGFVGATLRRNRIFSHDVGVRAGGTTASVNLSSDAIIQGGDGLAVQDPPPVGDTHVTATNVTLWSNVTDIPMDSGVLTLDSSIVQDPIAVLGMAACTITFSRGPTTGGNCDNFQTTADPMFAPDAYHLQAGSPMIDIGNPAPPVAPNDLDVDGQSRAIDENCDGTARRNIGADEIPTTCTPPSQATPPTTVPLTPTSTTPPAKKKKCKKKKRGAAAAKKCKRKK